MPLQPCRFDFKAMGSPCDISVYANNALQGAKAIEAAVSEIVRLENKFSRYQQGNTLHDINQVAHQGGSITVDAEIISLLQYADTCYQQSDGLFDITAGALRKVWDFDRQRIPTQSAIDHVLAHIGWQNVNINDNTLSFLKPKMEIDFGGIVKEYAADSAATICAQHQIRYGLINLGGDIKAIGPHPDGTPWAINVRDPQQPGQFMGVMYLHNEGLATSGNYERFIDINGQRYCHILSPKTGWPVSRLASVTVKAPQCVVAGSACTIAMLMEENGVSWLDNLGLENIWQKT